MATCTVRTAPPFKAKFDAIVQSVAVIAEASTARNAPPHIDAEFEVMAQFVALTVDEPNVLTAPPPYAEFDAIVHSVVRIVELVAMRSVQSASPHEAELEVIVQLRKVTFELPTA